MTNSGKFPSFRHAPSCQKQGVLLCYHDGMTETNVFPQLSLVKSFTRKLWEFPSFRHCVMERGAP